MAEIAEKPKPSRDREVAQRFFRHENAALFTILIVIIAAIAGITRGVSVTRSNISHILLRSSTTGVASIGQLFVLLSAGIDISVGGLAAMTMCLGGALVTGPESGIPGALSQITIPLGVGLLIMFLLGLGIGTVNGSLVSRIRMPPLIVTIAMWQIARGAANGISHGARIRHLPTALALLGQQRIGDVPVPFIIFMVVAVVAYFVLYHTTFGKSVYAVGGNEIGAWLSGIKTSAIKLRVYIISSLLATLAGLLIMSRAMIAAPASVGSLELDTIAAVCIGGVSLFGGRGTLIGVVIGVMILSVISNGMNVIGLGQAFQDVVRGVIIFAAVAIDVVRRR